MLSASAGPEQRRWRYRQHSCELSPYFSDHLYLPAPISHLLCETRCDNSPNSLPTDAVGAAVIPLSNRLRSERRSCAYWRAQRLASYSSINRISLPILVTVSVRA